MLVEISDAKALAALRAGAERCTARGSRRLAPAYVGSARKVANAIAEVDRRRSNYDLFEDVV